MKKIKGGRSIGLLFDSFLAPLRFIRLFFFVCSDRLRGWPNPFKLYVFNADRNACCQQSSIVNNVFQFHILPLLYGDTTTHTHTPHF